MGWMETPLVRDQDPKFVAERAQQFQLKQITGAIVAEYALRRYSTHNDMFDVRIVQRPCSDSSATTYTVSA